MPTRKTKAELLGFTVFQRYSAPLSKIWEAATHAKHLNRFFTNGAKGDITPEMRPVTWHWKGVGSSKVQVTACETGKFFEFQWTAPFNYPTTVRFEFSREKGKTVIRKALVAQVPGQLQPQNTAYPRDMIAMVAANADQPAIGQYKASIRRISESAWRCELAA